VDLYSASRKNTSNALVALVMAEIFKNC